MEIGQPAKMVEKVGYKGQQAAHLGLVIQSYIQQSLGNLLQYMQLNEYDKEKAVQKVRHFCILILENKTTILSLLYQLGFIVNKSKSQLGKLVRSSKRFCLSDTRKTKQSKVGSIKSLQGSDQCQKLLDSVRDDRILPRNDTKCKVVHATNPASFATE